MINNIMESLEPIIQEDKIQVRVKEIAGQISRDYANEAVTFLVVLKGAVFFAVDLAKRMTIPVTMEFIQISSYSGTKSTGKVTIKTDVEYKNITGKHVIIIEDVVDTGITIVELKSLLQAHGAKSIKVCTLFDKPSNRVVEMVTDYAGFVVPNRFVVGYGCDIDDRYRTYPYVSFLYQDDEG